MRNRWMARELRCGEAFDISRCKRTRDGDYVLPRRMHILQSARNQRNTSMLHWSDISGLSGAAGVQDVY
jgi:hypothetical protein